MTKDKEPQKRWPNKHFWYSLMPLLVTLLAIVLINWVWPAGSGDFAATPTRATAVAVRPTTASSAAATRPPILPATLLPSPTPTITPRPMLGATSTIMLLGPPPESNVTTNGRLTFYWAYSEPLLPGQQFVLTLWQNDTVVSQQTLAEPNLGDYFQLLVNLADLNISPGTAVWQLHLEWDDEPQPLLSSEERTIILLPE